MSAPQSWTIPRLGSLGYRPQLDGIRALAIMPVVGLHAFGWPRNGSLGVDLFFVLSGFLITTLLLEERVATGTISFLSFYHRRAARLSRSRAPSSCMECSRAAL